MNSDPVHFSDLDASWSASLKKSITCLNGVLHFLPFLLFKFNFVLWHSIKKYFKIVVCRKMLIGRWHCFYKQFSSFINFYSISGGEEGREVKQQRVRGESCINKRVIPSLCPTPNTYLSEECVYIIYIYLQSRTDLVTIWYSDRLLITVYSRVSV